MFDIDHFKLVNDEQGHLCGDHVLRELADRLRTVVRAEELLARYGGEEFVVALPEVQPRGRPERGRTSSRQLTADQPFCFDGVSL